MQTFIQAARDASALAADVMRHYYTANVDVDFKDDDSPVTRADIESEKAIRTHLSSLFPDHGFYGEELGNSNEDAEYVWLIDPIDGTKSFVRGYPMFSTQIALAHRGELIVGVSNAPLYGECAWAAKGHGAFLNDQPIHIASERPLSRATLSVGNIATLASDAAAWSRLGSLMRQVHRHRGYGDFLHYHLLASGRLDMILESDVNILDIAALTVIIREAGGLISDRFGLPIDLHTTSVAAAATPSQRQILIDISAGS